MKQRGFIGIIILILFASVALGSVTLYSINNFTDKTNEATQAELLGNLQQLEQFTSTTSPSLSITQRSYGKDIRLTGLDCNSLTNGGKLTLDVNGIVICDNDLGSGGGGSGGGTFSTSTLTNYATGLGNYPNNATDVVFFGNTGSSGTSTAEYWFDPNFERAQIARTSAASTTLFGNVYFPSKSQGYAYLGTNGGINTVSTSTLAAQVFPFSSATNYNSTSTALGFLNGFFSTASSTVSGNFYLSALTQGFAYVGSNGKVNTLASSSILLQDLGGAVTDAQVPDTITINTAGALSANGANCSSGNAPLGVDASGAVENCFDVWTEAENTAAGYVANTRTLTVAGTANQITSSAGAQDLTANRTWTLSFPNQVVFPQYASTTLGFSTPYASSTNQVIGTLTFGGVTGSAWSTFCTSITGSADLCDGSDASGAGGSSAYEIATTSDIALSQLAYVAKVSGRTTLASVATSSLAVGSSLSSSGTLGAQVGGTNSTLSINLANPNTWTANQTFNYSSSTAYSSFKVASTTNLIIGGDNFNDLTGTGLAISGNALTATLGTTVATNEIVGGSTNTVLVTNGADTVAWAKLDLANMVTGTLPIANGGTATTTGRYGGIYFYGGDVFRQASTTGLLDYDPTRQLFTTKYSSSTDYASFNVASTTFLRVGLADGCLNVTSGLVGSTGSACGAGGGGSDPFSHTLFGGQAGGNFFSATTSMMAIGTSTAPNNISALTVSSSTAPQLSLSSGAGIAQWTMRNAGGNLYFSTTTVAGTATTSTTALTLQGSGVPSLVIGTSTPSSVSNGMVVLGTGAANASSTIMMGKIQFDGYTTGGSRQCVMWTGTAWTSVSGACTQ